MEEVQLDLLLLCSSQPLSLVVGFQNRKAWPPHMSLVVIHWLLRVLLREKTGEVCGVTNRHQQVKECWQHEQGNWWWTRLRGDGRPSLPPGGEREYGGWWWKRRKAPSTTLASRNFQLASRLTRLALASRLFQLASRLFQFASRPFQLIPRLFPHVYSELFVRAIRWDSEAPPEAPQVLIMYNNREGYFSMHYGCDIGGDFCDIVTSDRKNDLTSCLLLVQMNSVLPIPEGVLRGPGSRQMIHDMVSICWCSSVLFPFLPLLGHRTHLPSASISSSCWTTSPSPPSNL